MNYINRALVKQQAKDIIKGKVFYIFLVSLIVSLLANMSMGFNINTNFNLNNNDFELFNNKKDGYEDFYNYYDGFGDEYGYDDDYDFDFDNPIDDFEFDGVTSAPEITALSVKETGGTKAMLGGLLNTGLKGISFIVGIIFTPLTVTLAGMYLSLVRRKPDEPFDLGKELGGIFKNSFNETYLKKLLVVLLRNILVSLLSILLLVPGIIFNYSSYFSNQIMSDNPNLKPTEAIRLSKKMIKGNRTELFTLDLSFLPWYLLTLVTLGIASIYVIPYVETTKALYYENFRMRALQDGRITIDDFKSFDEKVAGFGGDNGSRAYGYTAPTEGAKAYYYAPPQSDNQAATGSYYYNAQPTEPVQTAEVPNNDSTAAAEQTAEPEANAEVDAEINAAEDTSSPTEAPIEGVDVEQQDNIE